MLRYFHEDIGPFEEVFELFQIKDGAISHEFHFILGLEEL